MTQDEPEPIHVRAPTAESRVVVGIVSVWHYDSFAEAWLRDARREAECPSADARRREVVFAAAFAESFFFEWIRDKVLTARKWDSIGNYFAERVGICDRWKAVTKRLHDEKLVPCLQDFQGEGWHEFCLLVKRRDAYLHAVASAPERPGQSKVGAISASQGTHRKIAPGWAVSVATAQALALVSDSALAVPEWLCRGDPSGGMEQSHD
jgi:hypothetical protein